MIDKDTNPISFTSSRGFDLGEPRAEPFLIEEFCFDRLLMEWGQQRTQLPLNKGCVLCLTIRLLRSGSPYCRSNCLACSCFWHQRDNDYNTIGDKGKSRPSSPSPPRAQALSGCLLRAVVDEYWRTSPSTTPTHFRLRYITHIHSVERHRPVRW